MLTKRLFFLLSLWMMLAPVVAQQISGTVLDDQNQPLVGAKVTDGNIGTVTDVDGNFSLLVPGLPTTLVISYLGYEEQSIRISTTDRVVIQLRPATKILDDVLVVGSRFAPRTAIASPVPIDNIKADELSATGQVSFDKQLTYTVPAFNSTQQTISDATAHFDPFDLRGLGPSRTLVLINGKRKNPSSLVYINDTPGKGEVGVDMKSIPAAAIERIEVLRDGASAQYGSDAIAGVINVILKDNHEYSTGNIFYGLTSQGDGEFYGYNVNTGFKVGRARLNVTHSIHDQKETNRPGSPGQDFLFGVNNAWTAANPSLGMIVGQPNMTTGDIFLNMSVGLNDNAEAYGFGGFTYRRGRSYALYRTPYWRPNDFGLHTPPGGTYQGFHPTFDTDIFDNTITLGVRGERNKIKYDVSYSRGGNEVDYTVTRSLNTTMGPLSPTVFRVGGYGFNHNVLNFDLARSFWSWLQLSAGSEMRAENFEARAGEEASYINGMHPAGYGPAGAQSFPGIQPKNEIDAVRYNIGAYVQADADVTDDFLLSAAVRREKYSDFGSTTAYKLAGRYKFWDDRLVLRASYSTGFRAPSLHQIYLSNIQTLISAGTVSEQGTFNNESSVLRRLGVSQLKQEDAANFTTGFALKPLRGLTVSVDYYNIHVKNRIVYSSSIETSDTSSVVYDILRANQITSLKFFLNAVNTQTRGVDIVANYSFRIDRHKIGLNLAANFNENKIDGAIDNPDVLSRSKIDVFDRKEQGRILTARPNQKMILGISYGWERFQVNLNNTLFGEVTWQHASDPSKDQTFGSKLVTDLGINYTFKNVGIGVNLNNLFDVYPDVIDNKGDVVTDLGGRFKYPWEVNQFGFNGLTMSANLHVRF